MKKKSVCYMGIRLNWNMFRKSSTVWFIKKNMAYKGKVEKHFADNDMNMELYIAPWYMEKVLNGMRLMSGFANGKNQSCYLPDISSFYANDLNIYFLIGLICMTSLCETKKWVQTLCPCEHVNI